MGRGLREKFVGDMGMGDSQFLLGGGVLDAERLAQEFHDVVERVDVDFGVEGDVDLGDRRVVEMLDHANVANGYAERRDLVELVEWRAGSCWEEVLRGGGLGWDGT